MTIATTKLIDSLIQPIWALRNYIYALVFIPFLVQSFFCIAYFSINLQDKEHKITIFGVISEAIIIATSLFFLWLEYIQLTNGGEVTERKVFWHFTS